MHSDNAKEKTSEARNDLMRKYAVKQTTSEPYYPWQDSVGKALGDDKIPVRLGDEREEIMSYDELSPAAKKKFEDGSKYWVFKNLIGYRKVRNKVNNNCPEWHVNKDGKPC